MLMFRNRKQKLSPREGAVQTGTHHTEWENRHSTQLMFNTLRMEFQISLNMGASLINTSFHSL